MTENKQQQPMLIATKLDPGSIGNLACAPRFWPVTNAKEGTSAQWAVVGAGLRPAPKKNAGLGAWQGWRAANSPSPFLPGTISATTPRKRSKQKINRQPAGDQNQPRQSSRSPIPQQHHQNHAGPNNIKPRHHRITKRPVRTLRQRPQPPQTENPNNRQNIKNQHSRNNVIQQIAIKVPIFSADRIVSPRQNQKRGPQALHQQSNPRHPSPIQNSRALEEQPIPRHGVISPRTGEQHPVDAPKSRNHNCQSHQSNAQPRKHRLQSSRSHAIRFRVLDRAQRKREKITKIHQQVQTDDHARTQRQ